MEQITQPKLGIRTPTEADLRAEFNCLLQREEEQYRLTAGPPAQSSQVKVHECALHAGVLLTDHFWLQPFPGPSASSSPMNLANASFGQLTRSRTSSSDLSDRVGTSSLKQNVR